MATTRIFEISIAQLHPHPRNARSHSQKQIDKISDSVRAFGFNVPILIDAKNQIICGHARVEAAKKLGRSHVPAIRIEHLSDHEIHAFMIADNRLAELSNWDDKILGQELQFLSEMDFDATITGFETPEVDLLIEGLETEVTVAPETAPEPDPGAKPISQCGDLWQFNSHRLLCGDATCSANIDLLMAGTLARMAFVDPPFNVPINGHVSGKGAVKHREFAMASGEMTAADFTAFLERGLASLAAAIVDGGLLYVCMDWRHLFDLQTAARSAALKLLNLCVWAKSNGGMGSLYRSQHELVLVFKTGSGPHVNNVELGRHGRNRTNVWRYPGVNSFREGREAELRMHPTVKPVALVADAIRDVTHRGDSVLDTFAGSGTTIIACEQAGRRAFAMELDPLYVDTAIRRWQEVTGDDARLASTGESFAEVAAKRSKQQKHRPDLGIVAEKDDTHNHGSDSHG